MGRIRAMLAIGLIIEPISRDRVFHSHYSSTHTRRVILPSDGGSDLQVCAFDTRRESRPSVRHGEATPSQHLQSAPRGLDFVHDFFSPP